MLVQGEPNQRLLLCKSLTFSARIFCGKKNLFVYLFAPNDHEQTAIYKNHSSYIYSVMHSYLLQKLSVFLLGYLGWLAVSRLLAEKKEIFRCGYTFTHCAIDCRYNSYYKNVYRKFNATFLKLWWSMLSGSPDKTYDNSSISRLKKKRSKPTKMIECAFFGREKKPTRLGPIWQIWWGHTPGS